MEENNKSEEIKVHLGTAIFIAAVVAVILVAFFIVLIICR